MIVLPLARGIAGQFKNKNRQEIGCLLTHMHGAGSASTDIVCSLSKVLKKMDCPRLVESHMAALRLLFGPWLANTPLDFDYERPTEEELTALEQAQSDHLEQFNSIEALAGRLSSSLGVGKIRDAKVMHALFCFMREVMRHAFNSEVLGTEEHIAGHRLSFLRIGAK
jgi:hypothetical protein